MTLSPSWRRVFPLLYPSIVPNEETRQRLIAEATRVFIEEGYGPASLDRIARAAGISKKTIYKYAASKADLFVAIVENAMRPFPVAELLARLDDEDPQAALRNFLRAVADLALSQDGLAFYRMILREAASFPEMLPRFHQVLAGFFGGLIQWIEHQNRRGWLAIDSAEDEAGTLLSLLLAKTRNDFILGVITTAPDAAERERLVDQAMHNFLHGALPRR